MAKIYKGNITGNIVELSLQDEAAGGGGGGTVQTPTTLQIRATDEGTVTGDVRGANSVDLQTARSLATQVASGSESMILGGHNNTAAGPSSEVIGSQDSTTTGTGSTVIGGNTINNAGNWSVAAGGRNHEIVASRVGVLGGEHAEVLTGHNDSVMLGVRGTAGEKKQSQAAATAHVDNLYIFNGFTMPTGAADTYVLTSDANGIGTWQAAAGGGGGGTVQNVNLSIEPTDEGTVAGNARAANSVDLQTARGLATQVASGTYSTISGGYQNTASNSYSTTSGGYTNTASGTYSTIGGGAGNAASGTYSTISGGAVNTASGDRSTVGGGYGNNATGDSSTVGGGVFNIASGSYSWAGGKFANTGANNGTFAWADSTTGSSTTIPNAANQFAIKAAGGLRLIDGNQGANKVLTCDADGVGTWQTAAGGGGGSSLFTDADATGATERIGASTATALGNYATVSGGKVNTASGYGATVGGGYGNTASSGYEFNFGADVGCFVGGGSGNAASGAGSTISGGYDNTASGYYTSTVSGGYKNIASNDYSTVGGGDKNEATGSSSTVGGGKSNEATGSSSTVGGGYQNTAIGDYSWAGGKFASTGPNNGTFAWADSTTLSPTIIPNAANQFAIKAGGGLRLLDGNEGTAGYVLTADAAGVGTWQQRLEIIGFACSDETTPIAATGTVITTDWPMDFVITRVYASLGVAGTGSATTVGLTDVDAATQILNADLSLGITASNDETSTFAAAATSYGLTKGDQVTIEVNAYDSNVAAAGLKVYIEGYRS